jgi:hypothetical protein
MGTLTQSRDLEDKLALSLGFLVEDRAGTDVVDSLAPGWLRYATAEESALWNSLLACARSRDQLQKAVGSFFEHANLSKPETDESSVCIDCSALAGSPHTDTCEVQALELAYQKSTQEKI